MSFDGRRELAIAMHDEALDLSDAGLRADLEGRAEGTAERLAIEC